MARVKVDAQGGEAARPRYSFPGGNARLPRILGPRRRPPGVDADEQAPPVRFVPSGFAGPVEEPEHHGPTQGRFTDWSTTESLFYTHEVEEEIDHAPAPTPQAALGVGPDASWEEVRTAYRDLVTKLHPDRLVDASPADRAAAADRLAEINLAYNTLKKELRLRR